MRGGWFLWIVALNACVRSDSVVCANGEVCPRGTVCVLAEEATVCVPADRTKLCDGVPDGDTCDRELGRCYDRVCVTIECGDHLVDPGTATGMPETCDDGNNVSGDGCSADCRSNETCGNGVVDPIASEVCDDSNARSHDGCGDDCLPELPRWRALVAAAPGPRRLLPFVYDQARGNVLMFDDTTTWLWNGHGWLEQPLAPGHASGAASAYHAKRATIIAYGGGDPAGGFRETWEWDGATWTIVGIAPLSLGPRRGAAMAYDPVRDRVILFGGEGDTQQARGDTWEWDGITWEQRATTGPPARAYAGMVYEPRTGQVLMFGGENEVTLGDFWAWNGSSWTQVSGATPPAMTRFAMAAHRGGLLIHGDAGTWSWNGASWMQLPVSGPPTGTGYAATTDTSRDRVVLAQGNASDVWEWNGTVWAQIPFTLPGTSTLSGAYDARRGRAIVVGNGTTYELVGGTWRALPDASAPLPGSDIAYDIARDELVAFAGSATSAETWTRDGDGPWILRVPPTSPPPRLDTELAYDRARQRVVLFGGAGLNDTWEWDGATWTQRAVTGPSPEGRLGHGLAYDHRRRVVVLFGGRRGNALFDDVWEWDGTAWTDRSPPERDRAHGTARASGGILHDRGSRCSVA